MKHVLRIVELTALLLYALTACAKPLPTEEIFGDDGVTLSDYAVMTLVSFEGVLPSLEETYQREFLLDFTSVVCDDERFFRNTTGKRKNLVLAPDTKYEITFEFYSEAFSETVGPRLLGTQTLHVRTCSQAELDAAMEEAEKKTAG